MPFTTYSSEATEPQMRKRRKIRKGTFSCWECKRRKRRCELDSLSVACVSCQRLGTPCIRQDLEEDSSHGNYEGIPERIDYVEGLLMQLSSQQKGQQRGGVLQHVQSVDHPSAFGSSHSGHLNAILPPPSTAALIFQRGSSPFEKFWKPGTRRAQNTLPDAMSHPVSFARTLLELALCLQQIDAQSLEHAGLRLDMSIRDTARHYAAAARQITSQDTFVHSVEGLETLLMEGCFNARVGKARTAWLSFRRACALGQLIGISSSSSSSNHHVEQVWMRINYSDRFASLALGLPCALASDDFGSAGSADILRPRSSFEKMEHSHMNIAAKIIARNVRIQRTWNSGDFDDDYEGDRETHDIEFDLKDAARRLPPTWWTLPTLHEKPFSEDTGESALETQVQLHHSYLVLLAHQPYVIHSSGLQKAPSTNAYIKNTAATLVASREILSIVLSSRKFGRVPGAFEGMDHKAYIGAVALILIHLTGHKLGRSNVFEHQRPTDLRLVGLVIDSMNQHQPLFDDQAPVSGVHVVKKLLEIESKAADDLSYSVRVITDSNTAVPDDCELALPIPYFGSLHIIRNMSLSLEAAMYDLQCDLQAGEGPISTTDQWPAASTFDGRDHAAIEVLEYRRTTVLQYSQSSVSTKNWKCQ